MKNPDDAIGAFDAKNRFSELLDRVGRGAEITITKHNRPVAKLVPVQADSNAERKKATAELKLARKRYSLDGLNPKELIDAGRR